MKEYYYLEGKDQKGPYSVEQLAEKNLTKETLIWTEGMDNWQKIKDIPQLTQHLKPKSVPPPPPSDQEKVSKTEVSGQLKVTTEKSPNPMFEAIKPNKKVLTWLIIWCCFHLFALLMSYSEIDFFNDEGKPRSDKFWPFVEFTEQYWGYENNYSWYGNNKQVRKTDFNGIFTEYDWSEFAFYVGGALVIFLLVRISNKPKELSQ